jgi:TPR repeat protein
MTSEKKMKNLVRALTIFCAALTLTACSDKLITADNFDIKTFKLNPINSEVTKWDASNQKQQADKAIYGVSEIKLRKKSLLELANNGNTEAMIFLATDIYSKEEKPNFNESYKMLKKASEQGNPRASKLLSDLFSVGKIYGNEYKVILNPTASVKYALDAAYQGNLESQEQIIFMQLIGYRVDENLDNAIAWTEIAYDNKSKWAYRLMGAFRSSEDAVIDILIEYGVQAYQGSQYDFAKGIFEYVIKKGNSTQSNLAMGGMANVYVRMNNYSEALAWTKKAANEGNIGSKLQLAKIYNEFYKTYVIN